MWWYEEGNDVSDIAGIPELLDAPVDPLGYQDSDWGGEGCPGRPLTRVYSSVKAHDKPTIYLFPIASILGGRIKQCLTPTGLEAVDWTAIIGGARGIFYHTQDAGSRRPYGIAPEIEARAARISQRVATIGPTLFAPSVSATSTNQQVKVAAHRYGGVTYLMAVNVGVRRVTSKFRLSGTLSGRARLIWETRTLSVRRGSFSDRFNPFQVHVYKVFAP
jgi:hypothetical protein